MLSHTTDGGVICTIIFVGNLEKVIKMFNALSFFPPLYYLFYPSVFFFLYLFIDEDYEQFGSNICGNICFQFLILSDPIIHSTSKNLFNSLQK